LTVELKKERTVVLVLESIFPDKLTGEYCIIAPNVAQDFAGEEAGLRGHLLE
jgi:hypothetical protein